MNKRIRKKRIRQTLLLELSIRFDDQDDAVAWLETPHDAFEGRTPREAIAAGNVEGVTMLLDQENTAARSHHAHS